MIYFPSWYDLFLIIFALANQFIKTLGTNKFFWQAVPMMNHLNGSYHSLHIISIGHPQLSCNDRELK